MIRQESPTSGGLVFRSLREAMGFAGCVVVVACSAIAAKEARSGAPALAQMDASSSVGRVELLLKNKEPAAPAVPVVAASIAPAIPAGLEIEMGRRFESPAPAAPAPAAERTVADAAPAETAAQPAEEWVHDHNVRFYDGRPIRPVKTMWMTVTAYSPDERSCGKWADGITASLKSVWTNGMKLVAADTRLLPMGSLVSVPGYDDGRVVPVLDRGGAIKGKRLDVLYPTHEIALKWGVRRLPVTVWAYVDEKDAKKN